MQTPLSIPTGASSRELLWVFGPSGWALGWVSQPQPVLAHPWPHGEPPVDCPAPELDWALRQAVGTQRPETLSLHLLVCDWVDEGRPLWWPDAARQLKPWRALCLDAQLRLASVRSMAEERGTASLWEAALNTWPEAPPLRGANGWAWRLSRSPGWAFGLSAAAVVLLHGVLTEVVRPALEAHRLALEAEAAQLHEQDTARKAQVRAQAQEVERQTQGRVWQNRQREALLPLVQLREVVGQAERTEAAHWWSEMRWSQGAWTIWGTTSHEAAWQAWQGGALSQWQIEAIESAPTVWPHPPEWGAPAWRYQVRIQSPDRDRDRDRAERPEVTP